MKWLSVAIVSMALGVGVSADDPATRAEHRVRPLDMWAVETLDRGLARSSVIRSLIDTLEQSDLIVHLQTVTTLPPGTAGQMRLSGDGGSVPLRTDSAAAFAAARRTRRDPGARAAARPRTGAVIGPRQRGGARTLRADRPARGQRQRFRNRGRSSRRRQGLVRAARPFGARTHEGPLSRLAARQEPRMARGRVLYGDSGRGVRRVKRDDLPAAGTTEVTREPPVVVDGRTSDDSRAPETAGHDGGRVVDAERRF